MVGVVQLVEHQVVILAVAGSSPVAHPSGTPENVGRHFRGFFWFVRSPNLSFHSRVNVSLPFSDGGSDTFTRSGWGGDRDKSRAPEQPVPELSERTSGRFR